MSAPVIPYRWLSALGKGRGEEAELAPFWVVHDCDAPTGQLFSHTGVGSPNVENAPHRGVEVLDEYIEVDPDLADLRLLDGLEIHERSLRTERLQAKPVRAVRARFDDRTVEESRQKSRLDEGRYSRS